MEQLRKAEKEWRLGTSGLKRLELDARKLKRGMERPIQGPPRNELPVLMRQLEEELRGATYRDVVARHARLGLLDGLVEPEAPDKHSKKNR